MAKVGIDYGPELGGIVTVEKGKDFAIERQDKDSHLVWSTRSGQVKFANGDIHEAVLEFCDSDCGEHYGTAVWVGDELVFDDDEDFYPKLGLTNKDVFPYKYRYHGYIHGDHHESAQF